MLLSMVDDREDQSDSIKKSGLLGDHGKLCIKLKLPKVEQEEDQDQYQHLNNSTTTFARVCNVCNKGFHSGKALGGHMRIHFQSNKEPIFNKKIKRRQPIKFKKPKGEAEVTKDFTKKRTFVKKSTTNGTAAAAGIGKQVPLCFVCGKNFPSMKSLFGHMRCHPGRDWRGIQPPQAIKTSSSSSVSDGEPQKSDDELVDSAAAAAIDKGHIETVDLKNSLLGWSATSKRGRKAISGNSDLAHSSWEDEEFRDAANDLMLLAHGDSFESGLYKHQRVEEFEATNSNSLTYKAETQKRTFEEFSVGYLKNHPVKQLRNEEIESKQLDDGKTDHDKAAQGSQWEDKDCSDDDDSDSYNTTELNYKNRESSNAKVINVKNKKRRKTLKLRDLGSAHVATSPVHQNPPVVMRVTAETPDKYRCHTCNKSFPTHQALGGHRSSHNKFRIVIQNSVDGSSSAAANEDENLAISPVPVEETTKESTRESDDGADSSHKCKICNKYFPTGQALGGHKRCHWIMEAALSSQVTSLGEVSHTGRRVLDFDLNETPPLEDGEHVAGGVRASYSYNSVEFPVF